MVGLAVAHPPVFAHADFLAVRVGVINVFKYEIFRQFAGTFHQQPYGNQAVGVEKPNAHLFALLAHYAH